jgi:hypothetical protein
MSEYLTLDPADFTVDELESAARGESPKLTAPKAVILLRAKLGDQFAVERLLEIADTSGFDSRARETAIHQLGEIPDTRPQLQQLTQNVNPSIAALARQTLER